MGSIGFPTSSDIYIEVGGKKVAVVQSYRLHASRTEQVVEAFGEKEPVATIASSTNYKIELTRLYATQEAISDGLSFYELDDFSLVIVKPDRRIIFTNCQWSNIEELAELSAMVIEKIVLLSSHRLESFD